jgi:hemerythrin
MTTHTPAATAEAATAVLSWHDGLLLGHAPLDGIHEEFVGVVAALQTCADADMLARMQALGRHCREHFGTEDRWMAETGFPPRQCHMDEHAAVMASVEGVTQRVEAGDFAAGRSLATALADWFPGHADYLDSALAQWMFKRQWGGKPVELRRDLSHVPTPPQAGGEPNPIDPSELKP